jgi:hypothetical protein
MDPHQVDPAVPREGAALLVLAPKAAAMSLPLAPRWPARLLVEFRARNRFSFRGDMSLGVLRTDQD